MSQKLDLKEGNLFFETITGSVSRGTNIEGSDEDRKGIFMPHHENLYNLNDLQDTICIHEPEDREYHTLKKFMNLAGKKGNPTILEMLFTEDRFITYQHELMEILRSNNELFLTKQCYYSFHGYAKDQLMRIKNAKLDVQKEEKQEHLDYVVNRVLKDVEQRYEVFNKDGNRVGLNEVIYLDNDKYSLKLDMHVDSGEFTELFGMLNELRNVLNTYNTITGRNKKPNEARLWKHAMQLVVLLKMGKEILDGQGLNVYRYSDREELLQIRRGELSWEEFYKYVDGLTTNLEFSNRNTRLPDKVDVNNLNTLYRNLMESYYYN